MHSLHRACLRSYYGKQWALDTITLSFYQIFTDYLFLTGMFDDQSIVFTILLMYYIKTILYWITFSQIYIILHVLSKIRGVFFFSWVLYTMLHVWVVKCFNFLWELYFVLISAQRNNSSRHILSTPYYLNRCFNGIFLYGKYNFWYCMVDSKLLSCFMDMFAKQKT